MSWWTLGGTYPQNNNSCPSWINCCTFILRFLFIYSWETHRDIGRGRSRLPPGSQMQDSILGSCLECKVDAQPLSHPGIPEFPLKRGWIKSWLWFILHFHPFPLHYHLYHLFGLNEPSDSVYWIEYLIFLAILVMLKMFHSIIIFLILFCTLWIFFNEYNT